MKAILVGVVSAGLVLAGVAGCPKGVASAIDVGTLVTCVLSHEQEPVAQIVTDCGADGVKVVEDILAAHRAATARERAAGTLPACDGGAK